MLKKQEKEENKKVGGMPREVVDVDSLRGP